MQTPIGPSLHLAFCVADAFAEVSLRGLTVAWERWIGPQRFHRKLAQFERLGWVDRPHPAPDLEAVIRITDTGRLAALGGRDPTERWRRRWDGRWRFVLFDLPESQRARRQKLQRKLRGLGFGYLQHSVWITPDSVDELKRAIADASIHVETLTFMEARPCGGESDADLVLGAWDFGRINRHYDAYLDVLNSAPWRTTGKAARNWFAVEWKAWSRAVATDPLLPEALLPASYRGREAWRQRGEILRKLLKAD